MSRPTVLLTNDDGIGARFLRELAAACQETGLETWVAAPTGERSWIGRAFSRNRIVPVADIEGVGDRAWALDGTPSDCVNIALGHLLPRRPDVVLSGMNIGYNASMPLCLSSGTLAGATEGAAWGLPAVAASFDLDQATFEVVRHAKEDCPPKLLAHLRSACRHAARFTAGLIGQPQPGVLVHNLNFPSTTQDDTAWERTVPAHLRLGSLYARDTHGFSFIWSEGEIIGRRTDTDVACIERGNISHTEVDFARLGRD